MLQIETFLLPREQDKANAFLRTHKPNGEIARMGDLLFVAYDDGEYSPAYEIADCRELLEGSCRVRMQHEIALAVMRADRDKLNPKKNKQEFDGLSAGITNLLKTMDTEALKASVVEERIKALQSSNGGDTTGSPEETGDEEEEA